MNIFRIYKVLGSRFRRKRMREFAELFEITCDTRIVDIGGSPEVWDFLPIKCPITLVNMNRAAMHFHDGVVADGRFLPFKDDSFDIAFSNSVIEHVGDWDSQARFAAECRRVAKRYYVQTPNRRFPIEPHWLAPFVHWLPLSMQRLAIRFTPWAILTRASRERCDEAVTQVRLISPKERHLLFPDARAKDEYVLGIRKSLISIRL